MAIGAFGMAAVQEVKRGIVAGRQARDHGALDRLCADDYTAIDSRKVSTI